MEINLISDVMEINLLYAGLLSNLSSACPLYCSTMKNVLVNFEVSGHFCH